MAPAINKGTLEEIIEHYRLALRTLYIKDKISEFHNTIANIAILVVKVHKGSSYLSHDENLSYIKFTISLAYPSHFYAINEIALDKFRRFRNQVIKDRKEPTSENENYFAIEDIERMAYFNFLSLITTIFELDIPDSFYKYDESKSQSLLDYVAPLNLKDSQAKPLKLTKTIDLTQEILQYQNIINEKEKELSELKQKGEKLIESKEAYKKLSNAEKRKQKTAIENLNEELRIKETKLKKLEAKLSQAEVVNDKQNALKIISEKSNEVPKIDVDTYIDSEPKEFHYSVQNRKFKEYASLHIIDIVSLIILVILGIVFWFSRSDKNNISELVSTIDSEPLIELVEYNLVIDKRNANSSEKVYGPKRINTFFILVDSVPYTFSSTKRLDTFRFKISNNGIHHVTVHNTYHDPNLYFEIDFTNPTKTSNREYIWDITKLSELPRYFYSKTKDYNRDWEGKKYSHPVSGYLIEFSNTLYEEFEYEEMTIDDLVGGVFHKSYKNIPADKQPHYIFAFITNDRFKFKLTMKRNGTRYVIEKEASLRQRYFRGKNGHTNSIGYHIWLEDLIINPESSQLIQIPRSESVSEY